MWRRILPIVFVTLVLVVVKLSYRIEKYDNVAMMTAASASSSAQDPYLFLAPVISAVNGIVDFVNALPSQFYDKTVGMSMGIGNKIKEYGETMKNFNRTPDTDDALQYVSINTRHKTYIDRLVLTDPARFSNLKDACADFYGLDFDAQDDAIASILTTFYNNNDTVTGLLSAKLASKNASV